MARYAPEQVLVGSLGACIDCSRVSIDLSSGILVLLLLSMTSIGSSCVPGMGEGTHVAMHGWHSLQ